jgi:hypothetical protein
MGAPQLSRPADSRLARFPDIEAHDFANVFPLASADAKVSIRAPLVL